MCTRELVSYAGEDGIEGILWQRDGSSIVRITHQDQIIFTGKTGMEMMMKGGKKYLKLFLSID